MNRETIARRRNRTHAIVEGALLGDIAIVFLLMRVYLPAPGVRQILRAVATIPLVMLVQRRGLKLTILAAIASYILFSALVGPILALAAIDIAVAGILLGVGRKFGINPVLNTLWTGAMYAILDLVIPTIVSVIVFRYPVNKLAQGARNFFKSVFNVIYFAFQSFGASSDVLHRVNDAKAWSADHWQFAWIITMIVYGVLNMYLVVIVAEIVLRQIPEDALAEQSAA